MPGPPPSAGPPSSGDPSAVFARVVRRSPSTTTKLAIAVAGIVAVLLAFGILTVLKMAAQSMGMLSTVSADRPYAPSPSSMPGALPKQLQGPSSAVTVTVDASRPTP
jgi:hypothetical protein